ncbi:MAG: DUF368 domain-containing protein [Bacilli bacterium]
MKYLILILKGFIIGVAKIVPGVSGAMLAISMGIYEKALKAISHFFKNPLENLKFLVPLGFGAILAIIVASKAVLFFLNNYYLPTMLLFIGLIVGGVPMLFKKVKIKKLKFKHYLTFIIAFLFVFLISLVGEQNIFANYSNPFIGFILFFFIGITDAITMIIPGVSGTAVMMILGCYNLLLTALGTLTNFNAILINLGIIIPFVLGLVIGIIGLSKAMNYLFEKKQVITYCGIIGFAFSSILALFLTTLKHHYSIIEVVIGLVLLLLGVFISKKLEK